MDKIQLDSSLLKSFEFLSIEQAGIAIKEYSNFLKTRQIKMLEDNAANLAYHYLTESTLSFWQQQEKIRLRRATGGSRGGRPKKNNLKNHKVTKVLKDENVSIFQNPLIDNKNIIKEENIIQDNNIRDNNNLSDDKYIIPKKEKEINKEKSPTGDTKKADKDKVDFDKFAEYYNAAMQHRAIKPISRITDRRKENLTARTREFGKEALQTVVDKAAASDFLNGKNNKGWVADFDWIMRPNNFPKVLEGNYDNDKVKVIPDSVDPDVKDGTKLRQSEMDYTKGLW